MFFNSIDFAIFLPLVFALYWLVDRECPKYCNLLLLVASYVFYGWWDWRFLFLIAGSSLLDYFIGTRLARTDQVGTRRMLLLTSLAFNLGCLGFFKYFNFFADNFATAFSLMGQSFDAARLQIVLPVGISFYTFQTLSYSIDVYKRKLQPTHDIVAFFAFVSFFPQLVAGPIERASHLLPQFNTRRVFDPEAATDGLRQILWGLFKKMVVADNCALLVNQIFNNYTEQSGSTLAMGAAFFAFQIYGDFSGYSDIAIGTSRLFGFDLMRNFAFPYFARDIAEFWRRWHISLSTWFRDYLYIPLGGSRGGTGMIIRNTFIIFLVSGFWHGANWTFVIWGALHALYFLPLILFGSHRRHVDTTATGRRLPGLAEFLRIVTTFCLVSIAWVFFRAENVTQAFDYLRLMFSKSLLTVPALLFKKATIGTLMAIGLLVLVEWIQREKQHGLEMHPSRSGIATVIRWAAYLLFVLGILHFAAVQQEFIYFQF